MDLSKFPLKFVNSFLDIGSKNKKHDRKMDRQDDSYTTHKDKFLFSSHTFNF